MTVGNSAPELDRPTLTRAGRSLVRDMTRRCGRIAGGEGQIFPGLPTMLRGDEAAVVEPVRVGVYAAPAGSWSELLDLPVRDDGQLWVTSSRLVVSDRRGVQLEWSWNAFCDVRAIADYSGLVLTRRDNDRAVVLVRGLVSDPALMPRLTPLRRWLTVEATYAAAVGRLDGWLAELPSRL